MKTINITKSQQQSIANYRRMGLDVEVIDNETVKITQSRLLNGYILNNKQLYDRAKEVFPDMKIIPVVYSLQVDDIDLNWIESKMDEFSLNRKDLIKQLAIDKSSLSLIFSGNRELSKPMRATFFYYFLTYELNRDLREQLNVSDENEAQKWDNEKIAAWLIDVRLLLEGQKKEAISQLDYLIKELSRDLREQVN